MSEEKPRRGLGRGLSALFGEDSDEAVSETGKSGNTRATTRTPVDVPVELLQSGRFQPRQQFDEEGLDDLAQSIREKGIIQPILVRRLPEDSKRYEIIAGERRWRAAQIARRQTVPVLIRDFSDRDAAEVALIENLQRRDLSALEEAEGYRRLQEEFQHNQDDLSRTLGKSRSHVANMMRLLGLPDPVKVLLRNGSLSAGHARALLNAEDPVSLANVVVKKGLNVRQTERLATEKGGVRKRKTPANKATKPEQGRVSKDSDTMALEKDLARILGLKVNIEFEGRGGRILIHYESLAQLDDILYRLNNPTDNSSDQRRAEGNEEEDNYAFAMGFAKKQDHPLRKEEVKKPSLLLPEDALIDAWDDALKNEENEMAGLFD
ncbi:ParB/RepB/Spo0J family partition protein [Haematospirillum jordaniae]|uniref:ParB/RepB/Spo0J family partition protein n=1 Tax=Haematospirillum jordaniae TaxID=1549855 RepID=UPI0009ED0053|nr:ParB/RepB/Spo0J family partition protein [Haematospirillum jordaniae]NKD44566.1 ParB/RepB/Spo0J family partition protein [Haematospirillum jordaniae]NKD57586.1 ParB/RepB/Spo0J family partition protein [Haematospirillum jordaniae]NKD59156.1 ParB/RepB/Spo0J family partition protein [Haematospirillum jordaniae]NKD67294.1 ParB/RepB/Spo0J family partition protein [Haematospirillum jordaniae]NKD79565.1 ParB/RepB/Spo0J family partition protein [Haematospirillum jordaniae]